MPIYEVHMLTSVSSDLFRQTQKFINIFFHADTFSKPVSGSDEPQQGGWFRTFTIAAYKPYFDVDTSDVLERIKDSLFPFKGSFSEKTASNPDL